jgi:hypothetical protein
MVCCTPVDKLQWNQCFNLVVTDLYYYIACELRAVRKDAAALIPGPALLARASAFWGPA